MKRALLMLATMLAAPAGAQTVAITGGTVAIGADPSSSPTAASSPPGAVWACLRVRR